MPFWTPTLLWVPQYKYLCGSYHCLHLELSIIGASSIQLVHQYLENSKGNSLHTNAHINLISLSQTNSLIHSHIHSHIHCTHLLTALTHCTHSLTHCTHSLTALTHCTHSLTALTHSLHSLTHCTHSLTHCTHSITTWPLSKPRAQTKQTATILCHNNKLTNEMCLLGFWQVWGLCASLFLLSSIRFFFFMQRNHIDASIFPINTFLSGVSRCHNINFKALALL